MLVQVNEKKLVELKKWCWHNWPSIRGKMTLDLNLKLFTWWFPDGLKIWMSTINNLKILKENPGDYIYHTGITELFLNKTADPEDTKKIVRCTWPYKDLKLFQWKKTVFAKSIIMTSKSNFYSFVVFSTLKMSIPQVAKLLIELHFKMVPCEENY